MSTLSPLITSWDDLVQFSASGIITGTKFPFTIPTVPVPGAGLYVTNHLDVTVPVLELAFDGTPTDFPFLRLHEGSEQDDRPLFSWDESGSVVALTNANFSASGSMGLGVSPPLNTLDLQRIGSNSIINNKTIRTGQSNSSRWLTDRADESGEAAALVGSGYRLGAFQFRGYDGSLYRDSSAIYAEVDGAPGAGDMPGRIMFYTTPNGSTTLTFRMVIKENGRVGINDSGPDAMLDARQSGVSDNIPAAQFEQLDESEGIVNYVGSARGTGNLTDGDVTESFRVELNGTKYRVALYPDE